MFVYDRMAPEVIRNENCSEKVDVWSFGVGELYNHLTHITRCRCSNKCVLVSVLWELLTCEIPYKDFDSSAIIWGVGNLTLHLPIPTTVPEGYKLLIKQCWSSKPKVTFRAFQIKKIILFEFFFFK